MTAMAIPTAPSELEEFLHDSAKIQALAKEPDGFQKLATSYAQNFMNRDRDAAAQIEEQVKNTMTQFLKDNKDAGYAPVNLNPKDLVKQRNSPIRNDDAIGARLDGKFKDFPEFLQNVWHGKKTFTPEESERMALVNEYSERVPDSGGFLVPEEYRSAILALSLEESIVRPRATVIPMSSRTLNFPTVDATSNVSSVYGGVVVYRTEEGAELSESAASFSSVKLEATKQTALAHVTNELLKDGPAFGAFLDATFPKAMAWYEDLDYIGGTGAGEPLGGLNSGNPAMVVITTFGGGLNTITWEQILSMYSRMLPSSINNAVWVASNDTFVQLGTLALAVGTGGSAVWITDAHGNPQLTLLGRPVIMSEKAPGALGTQGDLSFVDWSMYLIGDRQTMTVDSSPHVKFTSDKTTFRVIQRNDGRPWLQSAITPHNGGATLSPFVQISSTRV